MIPPPLTITRIALAFTVAAFADALQIPIHFLESNAIINYLGIPVHFLGIPIDFFAAACAIILLGFHLALLPSFFIKFVPAVAGLPTWTAAVGYVVWSRKHGTTPEPTSKSAPEKSDIPPSRPPGKPKSAPSGLWILAIGAAVIGYFIWSKHAPVHRVMFPSSYAGVAEPTPTLAFAQTPNPDGKIIVAVGPMENLSSATRPFRNDRGFDARTGLPNNSGGQPNPNPEAVCGILEDQLSHIDGIETVGREQMRALRSQFSDNGLSEKALTAKVRNLFPANIVVLLAIMDMHEQKSDFNGYGIKTTTFETICSVRVQVMNAADGTITFTKILKGSKSDQKSDTITTASTEDPGFAAVANALRKLENDTEFQNAVRGKPPTTPNQQP